MTVTHQCIFFTVLFSVLVVSDQSAVPDMSSSEKNFIGQFTIVCVDHRLDWLWIIFAAIVITHNVNLWIFCEFSFYTVDGVDFCADKL